MKPYQTTTERSTFSTPAWADLLNEAVTKPGMMLAAYRSFHNYSLGNQMLALFQCYERNITPGPIATYPTWKSKGRQVRKGEKAILLCMPITCKRKADQEGEEDKAFTRFTYKPNWFVLSQTEGEPVEQEESAATWDRSRALAALGITECTFDHTNGNVQGFARRREIAVSPLAALPHKTTFHELAHIVLGHTSESSFTDSERTPKSLREVEAEAVAMLLCESLGLPGAEFCRGYIQSWLDGASAIPEKSAQKIFNAADKILKAGLPVKQAVASAETTRLSGE